MPWVTESPHFSWYLLSFAGIALVDHHPHDGYGLPLLPSPGVIVVVEDPFVRGFLRNVLTKSGYQVVPAELQHALELVRADGEKVDLLITNTPAVFAEVAERIPLLYLAALPDPEQASGFRACRILRKPFHPRQLLAAVAELAGSGLVPV